MLGKCAEALALRKAFPEELAGVYTDEEMQQAGEAESKVDHSTPNRFPVAEEVLKKTFKGAKVIENPEADEEGLEVVPEGFDEGPPIESYDPSNEPQYTPAEQGELIPKSKSSPDLTQEYPVNEKQIKRMFAIMYGTEKRWDKDTLKAFLDTRFSIKSSKQLKRWQYDEVCNAMEAKQTVEEALGVIGKEELGKGE